MSEEEARTSVRSTRASWRDWSDETARSIREHHAAGRSQSETARALGLSRPDVSRWSRREGLSWGPTPAGTHVQAERLRAQRLQLAEAALSDAIELRKRLWDRETQHVSTREGVEVVISDLPTARSVADLTTAVERLVRVGDHAAGGADPGVEDARTMLARLQLQIERSVEESER